MVSREQRDEALRTELAEITQHAEEWRQIAGRLPHWQVDRSGSEIVVHEGFSGTVLMTLHGSHSGAIADFLEAMDKSASVGLAELLWRIGGHGGARDIRHVAQALQHHLGLGPSPYRGRGR